MLRQDLSAQQKGADPSLEQKDALPGEYAPCTFVRFCEIFGIFWNEHSIHHNTINTPLRPLRQIAAELRQNCGRIAAELRQNGYTTQRYRETHRARCQETSDEKVTEAGSNGLDFVDLC